MAYNNGFPINYGYAVPQVQQPLIQQPVMQPFNQQVPQQDSSLIWVQGEAGAKSFLLAPNKTVSLWDSESPVIYLKSTDASGMPSMKVLDYKIRESKGIIPPAEPLKPNTEDFVTKEELESYKEEVNKLIKESLGV